MYLRDGSLFEVPKQLKISLMEDAAWLQKYEQLGARPTADAAPLGFGPEIYRNRELPSTSAVKRLKPDDPDRMGGIGI
jgi:hypothetical protein